MPSIVPQLPSTDKHVCPGVLQTFLNEPPELTPLARLRELRCPTLLLVGREDPIVPLAVMQQVQALVADSELRIVEQAAHSAYFEQPEAFNARVLEFLSRLG